MEFEKSQTAKLSRDRTATDIEKQSLASLATNYNIIIPFVHVKYYKFFVQPS